jgi:hypothetical protein
MFTIPSLRARECTDKEKDALNLLFLAVPLLNVALPFVWKSFPFIFTADCVLMAVRALAHSLGPHRGGCSSMQAAPVDAESFLHPFVAAMQGVYAWKGLIPGIAAQEQE